VPGTVQELRGALARHVDTAQRVPETEKTFSMVYQLHEVLQKYGAELSPEEASNLKKLDTNWGKFRDFVQSAGLSLQSNKEKSKEELLTKSHDFERHIKNILEEYTISGPFGPSWKSDEAFVQLDGLKEKVEELSKNDRDISDGLAIFHMDRPLCAELASLGEKLHTLALTWHLSEEWEQVHTRWQSTKMVEANLTEMRENMEVMDKRIRMFKESEMDSRWEVFFQIKAQIQGYERTAALISLLSDRALRPRHWDRILEYVR
jgi:dynein heavy chain